MEECRDNKGFTVLVVFIHKQVIIDSFKHCTFTVTSDGREDMLIHSPKAQLCNRPRPAIGLFYVERQEGLAHTYITKKTDHI